MPYKDMIEVAIAGYARQAVGPIPFGQFGHDDTLYQYTYDLERAKSLMAEAGYPNGLKDKVVYTYAAENPAEKAFAPLVKESFRRSGHG